MRDLTQSDITTLTQFANNGDAQGYYSYLSGLGNDYAELALGVVNDATGPGALARQFAENVGAITASRSSISGADWAQISQRLMEHDLAARENSLESGGNGSLTYQIIRDYHIAVFDRFDLPPTAWTAYSIVEGGIATWSQVVSSYTSSSVEQYLAGLGITSTSALATLSELVGLGNSNGNLALWWEAMFFARGFTYEGSAFQAFVNADSGVSPFVISSPNGGAVIGGSDGNEVIINADDVNSVVLGYGGDDVFYSGRRNDTIWGGDGDDTVNFQGECGEYDITVNSDGSLIIEHARGNRADGTDHVYEVEAIRFAGSDEIMLTEQNLAYLDPQSATVSGVFSSFGPSSATVTGVGTSNFTWGTGNPSGLTFASEAIGQDQNLCDFFELGTITFANGAIDAGTEANSVSLELTITLGSGESVSTEVPFSLTNTTNIDGDPQASADTVSLGAFGISFRVLEGSSASAVVFGRLISGFTEFEVSGFGGPSETGFLEFDADENNFFGGASSDDAFSFGKGSDTAYGGVGNDTFDGGVGRDFLDGGNGFDELRGGPGQDNIIGRDGFDLIFGGGGSDALYGNNGNDTVAGDAGADTVNGGLGFDELLGGQGHDQIDGLNGYDTLIGGDGNDTLTGNAGNDDAHAGAGDDLVNGGIGADTLRGSSGSDTLFGSNGPDSLFGGDDADRLEGNAGYDTLDGGGGDDTLRGGIGIDTFVFEVGFGADRILDFANDFDELHLSGSLFVEATPTAQDITAYATLDTSGFVVLSFGLDSLTLVGISNVNALVDDVQII